MNVFEKILTAEIDQTTRLTDQPGWSIARINTAIEAREHLRVEA